MSSQLISWIGLAGDGISFQYGTGQGSILGYLPTTALPWPALQKALIMRTLLRHTATNLYLQAPDLWTNNPDLALDFRFMDRALDFAERARMTSVELAFVFDNPQEVVALRMEKAALQVAA